MRSLDSAASNINENSAKPIYSISVVLEYKGMATHNRISDRIRLPVNLNTITNIAHVLEEQEYNRTQYLLRARTDQPTKGQDKSGSTREQSRNSSVEDNREEIPTTIV